MTTLLEEESRRGCSEWSRLFEDIARTPAVDHGIRMEEVTAARRAFIAKLQTSKKLGGRSVRMAAPPLRTALEEALTALEAGDAWEMPAQLASTLSLAVVETLTEAECALIVGRGAEEMVVERVQQAQLGVVHVGDSTVGLHRNVEANLMLMTKDLTQVEHRLTRLDAAVGSAEEWTGEPVSLLWNATAVLERRPGTGHEGAGVLSQVTVLQEQLVRSRQETVVLQEALKAESAVRAKEVATSRDELAAALRVMVKMQRGASAAVAAPPAAVHPTTDPYGNNVLRDVVSRLKAEVCEVKRAVGAQGGIQLFADVLGIHH